MIEFVESTVQIVKCTTRSRIHERAISARFLGITLRVLRLEISVYNVYIANKFQTTCAQRGMGGGRSKIHLKGDCE